MDKGWSINCEDWQALEQAVAPGYPYRYRNADPADSPRVLAADHAAALLPAALAFNLVGGSAVLGHAPGHPPRCGH